MRAVGDGLKSQRLGRPGVVNADGEAAAEQIFDQASDHIGPPAASQQGRLALVVDHAEAIGHKFADIAGRADDAGR